MGLSPPLDTPTPGAAVDYDSLARLMAVLNGLSSAGDGEVVTWDDGASRFEAIDTATLIATPVADALALVLALKADLASPAFTGNPTAPTQSAGNNSTRVATTAYADAAIADLIGTAPGVLDTLGEISDAVNDDANLYATIVAALALKAPLANPTFTGDVNVPDANAPTEAMNRQTSDARYVQVGATITLPETHTYAIQGAVTTSTVFPPFFVDESFGVLTLVKVTTKLGAGTATAKIRLNGSDEVTGVSITTSAATDNFADEATTDLHSCDVVLTAASGASDLSVTLHFARVVTL